MSAEVVERLSALGIHSVLVQFTDLHGTPKGKLVPLTKLDEWVHSGAGFAGPSIWGSGLPRQGKRSEYYGRVVVESLRPLPFMPGVAHAVCDGFAAGAPLDTCPRQVLKRQLALAAERGLRLWAGIEPEFFLLRTDAHGRRTPGDGLDTLSKPSYDLKSIHRQRDFLDDMRATLTTLGFDLEQMDHEDANGQYEINYAYDEALAAADRFQLFQLTAHAVAQRHGFVYSGMPKPLAGAPGSGLHFHLSLTDGQGHAVLSDKNGPMGLSAAGQGFAAGLLHHADALAALCAPTVNSYKRLAASESASGTTWAPVWKAVGDNNRTCLLRTVAGRLEWRLPDPSCNVYIALAATLAAGMAGFDGALPAPLPCDEDLYERHASGQPMPPRLPRDLYAALDALQANTALRAAVGEAFCEQFLRLKREEWDAWAGTVTDWEWARYAG